MLTRLPSRKATRKAPSKPFNNIFRNLVLRRSVRFGEGTRVVRASGSSSPLDHHQVIDAFEDVLRKLVPEGAHLHRTVTSRLSFPAPMELSLARSAAVSRFYRRRCRVFVLLGHHHARCSRCPSTPVRGVAPQDRISCRPHRRWCRPFRWCDNWGCSGSSGSAPRRCLACVPTFTTYTRFQEFGARPTNGFHA